MKPLKRREVINLLNTAGFMLERQGKHEIWLCPTTGLIIAIPNSRNITPGTLRNINNQIKQQNKLKQDINKIDPNEDY